MDNCSNTDGWIASSIDQTRLFWNDVYHTNNVAGYLMLFACFFLVWYALHIWGIRGKEKALDAKAKPPKKARKNN